MHQTFYIDVDEEISSVVDRLHKSMAVDNFFVIPKRAIMLQSAVNLKLLKREAEKFGKQVSIVTLDDIGASLARRSGIEVLTSLEGIESELKEDAFDSELEIEEDDDSELEEPKIQTGLSHIKHTRLKKVGTSDFYGKPTEEEDGMADELPLKKTMSIHNRKSLLEKKPPATASVQPVLPEIKQQHIIRRGMDMGTRVYSAPKKHSIQKPAIDEYIQQPVLTQEVSFKKEVPFGAEAFQMEIEKEKEQKIEKMFSFHREEILVKKEVSIGGSKIKKIFFAIVLFSVVSFGAAAAYLFVPSATITIEPNLQIIKSDLSIHASENSSGGELSIPLKVIDKDESITLQYNVTGKSSASGQKAHGTVVIYNSFSQQPQTLISTTRLQSENGKIYRLVKNAVVPGMTTIGGEVKPGAISTEILADEAGSDFNSESASFVIPGFQGGAKFDKFSAKTSAPIIGGTTEGSAGGQSIANQQDIDLAKKKTEEALKQKIYDQIKSTSDSAYILLDDSQRINISKSAASVKVGDAANNFDYTVSANVRALIFSEDQIKTLVNDSLSEKNSSKNAKGIISKIEYGPTQADFSQNTLELQIHAETTYDPNIDLEDIKRQILGKNEKELSDIVKNNSSSIKGLNVSFGPDFVANFISRVPQYSSRVVVELKK